MLHVVWSVCLCVDHMVCCAKLAEPIEMPSGGGLVGPKSHVLDGVEIPHGKGQFRSCPAHRKALGSMLCCGVHSKNGFFSSR